MHEHRGSADEIGPGQEFKGRGDGISPTLIGLVVLAVATVVFIVQNSERPKITFLFFSVRTRLWVAIALAIVLGVVLDRLVSMWWRRRRERS